MRINVFRGFRKRRVIRLVGWVFLKGEAFVGGCGMWCYYRWFCDWNASRIFLFLLILESDNCKCFCAARKDYISQSQKTK